MRASKLAHSLSRALCVALAAGIASVTSATAHDSATLKKLSTLAVPFVLNAGQWDAHAAFAAQTFAGTLFVTKHGELVYSLPGKPIATDADSEDGGSALSPVARERVGVRAMDKQNPRPQERGPGWSLTETLVDHTGAPCSMATRALESPVGYRPMQASISYFIGNDESKHAKALNTYERVDLGDMYPGINVQLRATGTNIEKIFTVAPKHDPRQIHISFKGADKLEIGNQGELIAHTGNGPVTFTAQIAFQDSASGERTSITVAYALDAAEQRYGFTLGDYDVSLPLVIDPLLRSTYLGAAGIDRAAALAVHPGNGDLYVAGFTTSVPTTFPGVSGGAQGTSGGAVSAFVSRFSADLRTLIQSTYIGAAEGERATALAIHPVSGDVYVVGNTGSAGTFPGVNGGAQSTPGGNTEAFVSRFSADLRTLIQSSYLGQAGEDLATAIAIHPGSGEVYVAGYIQAIVGITNSPFPGVSGGAQSTAGGNSDAYVSRFSADLTMLIQSTYLGGPGSDSIAALAIHPASGDVYVTGNTNTPTTSFPGTSGGAQSTYGGSTDAYVSRLSADLRTLIQSSYLGATGKNDTASALAIHPTSGDVYVSGYVTFLSGTTPFPGVSGGAQSGPGGGSSDAFVSRFSADLRTLIQSSYLGAAAIEQAGGLAVHPISGDVYVAGRTASGTTTFPGVSGGAQSASGGGSYDAFVSRFSADLRTLIQSSYLGATGYDFADALAIHPVAGDIYVAGYANAGTTTFPGVSGSPQSVFGGVEDAYVSRFSSNLASFASCNLDIDRDNAVRASTDGLLILRRMLGLSDSALIANAVNPVGLQTGSVAIANAIDALLVTLDVDGSGDAANGASDGLMLLRAMLGFTGTAVTTGVIIGTPPRNTWALIRPYLNDNCGTSFLP